MFCLWLKRKNNDGEDEEEEEKEKEEEDENDAGRGAEKAGWKGGEKNHKRMWVNSK